MWHSNVYEAILNLVVYIYLFDDMPGVQCCVVCWISCWNDTKCKMNETCLTLTRIDQHICWCSSALIDKETKQLTCKGILYIESKHKKMLVDVQFGLPTTFFPFCIGTCLVGPVADEFQPPCHVKNRVSRVWSAKIILTFSLVR